MATTPGSLDGDESLFDSACPFKGVVVCCTSVPTELRVCLFVSLLELTAAGFLTCDAMQCDAMRLLLLLATTSTSSSSSTTTAATTSRTTSLAMNPAANLTVPSRQTSQPRRSSWVACTSTT